MKHSNEIVPFRKNTPSPPRDPSPAQPLRPAARKAAHADPYDDPGRDYLNEQERAVLRKVYRNLMLCDSKLKALGYDKAPAKFSKQERGTLFELHCLIKDSMSMIKTHFGIDEIDDATKADTAAWLKKSKAQFADLDANMAKVVAANIQIRADLDLLNGSITMLKAR